MIIVHILLWILKIAGILLLLILGLVLLGMLILMFVPVRYELSAQGDIHAPKEIQARVSIRYFFRLIAFHAVYENEKFWWRIRIAWKKIGQDKKEEPAADETEQGDSGKEEKQKPQPEEAVSDRADAASEQKTAAVREEKTEPEQTSEAQTKKTEPEQTSETQTKKTEPEKEKTGPSPSDKAEESWKEKSRASGEKADKEGIPEKIKYTIHRICDKIKTLSEIKDRVETAIKDEVHQAAFRKGKETLFRLLKAWLPRKARGRIEYGLDDPYYTGKILAGLALFYPFFGQWLQIVPDFEKTALHGQVYIRGHIRMNHLAAAAIRLVADKNIRSTAKEVLRLLKRQKKEES